MHALSAGVLPGSYLLLADRLLLDRGINPEKIWVNCSCSHADVLGNPDRPISLADWQRFMRNLSHHRIDPWELGSSIPMNAHGFLSYLMQASSNIGEAIELAEKYISSRTCLFSISLYRTSNHASITLRDDGVLETWHAAISKFLAANFIQWTRALGSTISDKDINLEHVKPADKMSSTKSSSAQESVLYFPSSLLDMPIPFADPVLKNLARIQCEEHISKGIFKSDFVSQVRSLIRQNINRKSISNNVATRMNMSERSLRRKLQTFDTSIQAEIASEKMKYALNQLQRSNVSIDVIAHALGYESTGNFIRFFKSMTGLSPGKYKTSHT